MSTISFYIYTTLSQITQQKQRIACCFYTIPVLQWTHPNSGGADDEPKQWTPDRGEVGNPAGLPFRQCRQDPNSLNTSRSVKTSFFAFFILIFPIKPVRLPSSIFGRKACAQAAEAGHSKTPENTAFSGVRRIYDLYKFRIPEPEPSVSGSGSERKKSPESSNNAACGIARHSGDF